MARYEVILGDDSNPAVSRVNGKANSLQLPLYWNPNVLIIQNLTSNPVFISEGRILIPSATQYDLTVPANSTIRVPTNSKEFGAFLPLTPALSDPSTQIVKLIWDQLPNA